MIGQTISHYKILEKSRPDHRSGQGCSFRSANGTALGGGVVYKAHDTKLDRDVALTIPEGE